MRGFTCQPELKDGRVATVKWRERELAAAVAAAVIAAREDGGKGRCSKRKCLLKCRDAMAPGN